MASSDVREELNCSICLSIYTDPVMLRCGHNFCLVCIGEVLDSQRESGLYTCPECRTEFQKRPHLLKNLKLHSIAEHFRSTGTWQDDTGVSCTYCIHSSVPAVRTCLLCEASLCDSHLSVHSKSVEHVLTEPTTSCLRDHKCSQHKKVLEYYGFQDKACLCVYCTLGEDHRGHQMVPLNEASEKEKLREVLETLTAQTERTSDRIRRLEIAKDELSWKMSRVDWLCNTQDPLEVLEERETDRDDFCSVEDTDEDTEAF